MLAQPAMMLFVAICAGSDPVPTAEPLLVHEWGTFTSLQDESGATISGINSDDEPVPHFVHDLARELVLGNRCQGTPRCHPHVTMRLETPVVYFHVPPSMPAPVKVDVQVAFHGGWLTQYYPLAEANVRGLRIDQFRFGSLTSETVGSLAWNGLVVGGDAVGPPTEERVWTWPRTVRCDSVATKDGEIERFLFYRGVGRIDPPIRIARVADQSLSLFARWPPKLRAAAPVMVNWLWLVEVRDDATAAFRRLDPIELPMESDRPVATTAANFADSDFGADRIADLRAELHLALTNHGLRDDEAAALIGTWQVSYFKSPGLRLFFIVPNAWTEHYLPLSFSVPTKVTRAMVGRVELITRRHRDLLRRFHEIALAATEHDLLEYHKTLYEPLGRFRNALVLDELKRKPSEGLKAFVSRFRLEGWVVDERRVIEP